MKPFLLNFTLNENDKSKIEKILRESNCFYVTPSNLTDIYDSDSLRNNFLKFEHTEIKALLDVNIIARIIGLVDGSQNPDLVISEAVKKACAVMCFLVYSGVEANPITAILERSESISNLSPNEQDYLFRILDHIEPKVFADIALGRITSVPQESFDRAKDEVDSNELTQEDIERTSFEPGAGNRYDLIYMNLLKALLLYKNVGTEKERLTLYLEWSYNNSLSDQMCNIFVQIFLSDKRLTRMFKKLNSQFSETILKSIKNTAWDIYHFSGLEYCFLKAENSVIWYFATFDQALLNCSNYYFKLESNEDIRNFIGKFYSSGCEKIALDYTQKVNTRINRSMHSDQVISNLDNTISSFEDEIIQQLSL